MPTKSPCLSQKVVWQCYPDCESETANRTMKITKKSKCEKHQKSIKRIKCIPSETSNMNTRISVKENFDEEDLSDDVDDEVFVRDGKKSTLKMDKQKGDERPLMPPRRKTKQKQSSNPEVCSRQPCNIYNCLLPVYFGIATIISIAFLMLLYIFMVDKLPLLMTKFDIWPSDSRPDIITEPCLNVKLNNIWTQTIPKLQSHSQIKLMDVNKDNVEDIIIGIGTELDDIRDGNSLCNTFFNSPQQLCSGGVVAMDGKTGGIIWYRWLRRLVLSVQCDFEITGDFVSDCIVTGKGGLLVAISGADGAVIWELEKPPKEYYIDLYNVLIIRDLNSDNHMDLLATHTSGNNVLQSHLIIVSGREGKPLQKITVTPNEPILHAPQILTDIDGGETVLFITGDPDHSGGIYLIPIFDLLKGEISRIKNLFHYKTGILAPPVLVDMNSDGLHDIAYVADNNVHVIDGATYTKIWNTSLYDYVSSAFQITSVSSVTPAYYNNDWTPDLLVSFAVGSDYPEYYFSMTLVLNGKNGSLLLNDPIIRSSVSDTVGAITLSNTGPGHDAFIFWTAACQGRENAKEAYSFMPLENRAFWSDLCKLRFNSTLVMELYALSRYMDSPGTLLYSAKSHTVDDIDSQTFNALNDLIERNPKIPTFFKIMSSSRSKPVQDQMESMQPVDAELDVKRYGPENENGWGPQKLKYSNYDANENSNDGMLDYGLERDDDQMSGRNEKDYGRYRRSIQRPQNAITTMLPKVSASGIIAKSFDGNNLDLILAHYEVKSDESVQVVVGKIEECIQNSLALSSIPSSKYHGLPRDQLKEQVFRDCMVYTTSYKYPMNSSRSKILSLQMENLYITRNRITCSCKYANNDDKACDSILPYEKQSYPAYLGKHGNSAYKTRVPFD